MSFGLKGLTSQRRRNHNKRFSAVMLDLLTVSHMMISALFFLSFLFNFSINNLEDYNVVLVYD